jgi:tRNA pseudouridine55 synthase
MFGILLVNKPAGWSSRGCVNHIQRLVRPLKVGHTGTLDPLATGLLLIGIGPATRLTEYLQLLPKTYRATFQLDCSSRSLDTEEPLVPQDPPARPSREALELSLPTFTGRIAQLPPAFSALKVNGQPAYVLARTGQAVELKERTIQIDRLEILSYDYPLLSLQITCSSGTYIRTLGNDLAVAVGSSAVMVELIRTEIGSLRIDQAQSPEHWSDRGQIEADLVPAMKALSHLPQRLLTQTELRAISHGHTLHWTELPTNNLPPLIAAATPEGELAAILEPKGEGQWKPRRVFVAAARAQ